MSFITNFARRNKKDLESSEKVSRENSEKGFFENYRIPQSEANRRRNVIHRMIGLYDTYLDTYFDFYKTAFLDEVSLIDEAFPTVDYSIEARIKSRNSYKRKVFKKVNEGYTGKIYDVFGSKLIINSYYDEDGKLVEDEDLLTAKAIEISKFLEESRDFPTKRGVCVVETAHSKNYIEKPKESGYRSYHVLRHFSFPTASTNSDSPKISFYTEIQVKTRKMYEAELYSKECGHAYAYKNNRDDILGNSTYIEDDVPIFLKYYWNPSKLKDDITPLPFSKCFKKFFGKEYKDYRMELEARKQEAENNKKR